MRLAIGSDSQVRIDPFEEVRELETGARRERAHPHALLGAAGDLWAELAANGARIARPRRPRQRSTIDLDHPDLAGIAEADLPLGSGDLRIGRRRDRARRMTDDLARLDELLEQLGRILDYPGPDEDSSAEWTWQKVELLERSLGPDALGALLRRQGMRGATVDDVLEVVATRRASRPEPA